MADPSKEVQEAARTLSALGAAKGGKARAESLDDDQRREIAQKAAQVRWANRVPQATHGSPDRPLTIGGIEIPCFNLDNGDRVLTRIGFLRALGRKGKAKGGRAYDEEFKTPVFLTADNIKPFITEELIENSKPVLFKPPSGTGGGLAIGYKAELLPAVCNVFIEAAMKGVLKPNQRHIADRCKILLNGFATVGIIALVDEATGYQYDRPRKALLEILEAFISKELVKWVKMFPDDFYEELFRLRGWTYSSRPSRRPILVGKLTINLVYERLAPGVLSELKRLNPRTPRGYRKHKLFQRLTEDIGHPKLREHLASVITLMRSCEDWDDFYMRLEKSLPKFKPMPLFDRMDGVVWSTDVTAEEEAEAEAGTELISTG